MIRSALRLVRPCSDTTDPSRSRSFLTFAPSPTFAFAPHAVAMFMACKRGRGARLASRRCDDGGDRRCNPPLVSFPVARVNPKG